MDIVYFNINLKNNDDNNNKYRKVRFYFSLTLNYA